MLASRGIWEEWCFSDPLFLGGPLTPADPSPVVETCGILWKLSLLCASPLCWASSRTPLVNQYVCSRSVSLQTIWEWKHFTLLYSGRLFQRRYWKMFDYDKTSQGCVWSSEGTLFTLGWCPSCCPLCPHKTVVSCVRVMLWGCFVEFSIPALPGSLGCSAPIFFTLVLYQPAHSCLPTSWGQQLGQRGLGFAPKAVVLCTSV